MSERTLTINDNGTYDATDYDKVVCHASSQPRVVCHELTTTVIDVVSSNAVVELKTDESVMVRLLGHTEAVKREQKTIVPTRRKRNCRRVVIRQPSHN